MAGEYMLSDSETRQIAELFLSTSPWAGEIHWGQTIMADSTAMWGGHDTDGAYYPDLELQEGQRWSWHVKFSDPSGQAQALDHDKVLAGLRAVVYGELPEGADSMMTWSIRHWYALSVDERRATGLDATDSSFACQRALFGQKIFPTERELVLLKELRDLRKS